MNSITGKSCFIFTLGFLLTIAQGCSRNPHLRAEQHLNSAKNWMKINKPDEAAIEVRRAIQLDPRYADAHFELAKLEMKRGEMVSAFQSLLLCVKYDPNNREANIDIAEILLRGGRFSDAKTKAGAILTKWPGDPSGGLLLAESQVALGENIAARQLLDKLIKNDASNPRIAFDLAALDFKDHDLDKAIAQLQHAWELSPNNALAPVLLSRIYESRKQYHQAEDVLAEAVRRQPEGLQARYALAGLYLRTNRAADAEDVLKQVQQLGNKDSQNRAVVAELYTIQGKTAQAEAEYKRVLANYPDDAPNWRRLAALYMATGQRDQATAICDRLLKANAGDWETQALRGQIDLVAGNADQALLHFHQAQKINPDAATVYFNSAQAYLKQGNTEQAKSSLEEAVRRQPKYPAAWLLLAELAMRTGDVDRAVDDLTTASNQHELPPLQANLLLSQAYALKGQLDLADQTLSQMVERTSQKQTNAIVLYNLGWIRLKRGRANDAEKMATIALQSDPHSEDALYLLGAAHLAQKQTDQALAVVKARADKDPTWPGGFQTLGKVALQAGRLDEAEQAFKKALSLQQNSFSASLGLAETYAAQKNLELAHQTYEQLAKQSPNTAFLQMRLGQLEEAMGKWQVAEDSYKKSIALDTNNPIAKNNLAWAYVEHGGDLDLALKLAQEAKEASPQDPRIADTLGWIFTKKGAYEMAAQNFKLSLDKVPSSPTYAYHLGFAYYKMGRVAAARETLDKIANSSEVAVANDARKLLAQMPQPVNR